VRPSQPAVDAEVARLYGQRAGVVEVAEDAAWLLGDEAGKLLAVGDRVQLQHCGLLVGVEPAGAQMKRQPFSAELPLPVGFVRLVRGASACARDLIVRITCFIQLSNGPLSWWPCRSFWYSSRRSR
jgi:hypothetical protein